MDGPEPLSHLIEQFGPMDSLSHAAVLALQLILAGDRDVMSAVTTSLAVSLPAALVACAVGAPLGAWLAMQAFPARRALLIGLNGLLGLPPVVVGLAVYLVFSRAGPLGAWGLLFTPKAMIVCQVLLCLPIAVALSHRATEAAWRDYGDAMRIDGAGSLLSIGFLLRMESAALVTVFLAAFGRAIAEVGAIMIAGGNIRDYTRTLTTAIVLETSKGDIARALALGLILVALTLLVSALAFALQERAAAR